MEKIETNNSGFTLIELLIVIAIIGALSTFILFAINPIESMRRSRDTVRIQDVTNMRKALDTATAEGETGILPLAACPYSVPCKSTADKTRAPDGTGWLPVNIGKYLATLPVDPKNDSAGVPSSSGVSVTPYYYFASDGQTFRIATYLESTVNSDRTNQDGGTEANMLEVGTNLSVDLITP
jgi:prepilin-type N-terminal cleavage/methylation domain-containing protein